MISELFTEPAPPEGCLRCGGCPDEEEPCICSRNCGDRHCHARKFAGTDDEILRCCGMAMVFQDIWGVRRYRCFYRSHHAEILVNLATGERKAEHRFPWREQEP